MVRSMLGLLVISLGLFAFSPSASADDRDYEDSPSVFAYGYRGFFSGALVGTGAGYLAARHNGVDGEEWRTLVLGGGIGALTGSALGLGLGLMDLSLDQPGRANLALRDTAYGALFGVFTGAATGGLVALKSRDGEHVLLGTAVGTIVGAGIGFAIGMFEGERWSERNAQRRHARRNVTASLGTSEDAAGNLVWMPSVVGRM